MDHLNIRTKCIHSGYLPENREPRALPIYQSTAYRFTSAEEVGDVFDIPNSGHLNTRISNPTVQCVENKLADLEGGSGALCVSSGQTATTLAILNIAGAGDHVIVSSAIYGGTTNLFNATLRRLGIDFTFIPIESSEDEIVSYCKENTKCLFAETISNPSLAVLDIRVYASAARKMKIPFIIDNTFATPFYCRPIEYGANVVVHSTSKYLDGHGAALGGAIIDGGNFDWNSDKFPGLSSPDPSYHGLVYTETYGNKAYITKARAQLQRDFGCTTTPMNAFLLNIGLETLALRMRAHYENAMMIATWLEKHPQVSWVNYPGLPSNRYYALAKRQFADGVCGVISFGVKGGKSHAVNVINALKLIHILIHVADAKTCILHPASTTHRQLSDQQLRDAGVLPEMIRLSVGIESPDDLIRDLDQALNV